MSNGIGGHQRAYEGKTDTWLTPPGITDALGEFDLDPCAAPIPRWRNIARENWSLPETDGLQHPWFGRVYLNPPYGPETGLWLSRLADHGKGTALVFARTETEFFHEQVWNRAYAVTFLRSRLHFHWPDGVRAKFNAGAPSVLVAYGDSDARILEQAEINGKFIRL